MIASVDRWERLKSLFNQALDLGEDERKRFAHNACGNDESLARSLYELLAYHEAAGSVLAGPLITPERAAELVASGLRTFVEGELVAGRFRVLRFIAEGGMGEVYAAQDLELNVPVALKTIRPSLTVNPDVLDQFKLEVRLARQVSHRNVSRVNDLFRHEIELDGRRSNAVFLSMELLKGETLSQRLRRTGPMPFRLATQLILQMLDGLAAAHRQGIIHRDFKSSNVAIETEPDGSERVVIMDFGLASTERHIDSGGTGFGLAGTPAYMAPEQVRGGRLTPATDLYALGIVAFEMLTGYLPFRGNSNTEIAQLRLKQSPPALRGLVPGVPLSFERAVHVCLARDPARRPQSAQEVASRITGRYYWSKGLRVAAYAALIASAFLMVFYWVGRPHQPKPEAQRMVESARVKMENLAAASFVSAIKQFQSAAETDPDWAGAWSGLAYAYASAANAQQIPADEARKEARQAALRAIKLDGHSGQAIGVLAWVQSLDLDDWPNAEKSFRKATTYAPDDSQIHFWHGVHLRKHGEFRLAEAEDRRALELTHQNDPQVWCEIAFLYWTARQLDNMETDMRELLAMYPNFGFARYLHGRLLKEQGHYEAALHELDFAEGLQFPRVTVIAEKASVEAYRGRLKQARDDLKILTQAATAGEGVDNILIAGVYAKLGDFDSAFRWLERAIELRDSTILSLSTSPVLDPVRSDPRYNRLLSRLHFPN